MAQWIAEALSRDEIRTYAKSVRKTLGIESVLYFPVLELLENLPMLFEESEVNWQVVEDCELDAGAHAQYDLNCNTIFIKNSVYEGAVHGCGRDRMTIVHEIAHFLLLKVEKISFQRSFGTAPVAPYRDPEWQAKCLAGELMIPHDLVQGMTVAQVAKQCVVSEQAAAYQLKK